MQRETLEKLIGQCPFHRFLGIGLDAMSTDEGMVRLSLPIRPEFLRADGEAGWHGGIIASLVDIAGDYAVALTVGAGVPTINLRVDYLRPANGNRIAAEARVVRCGRTIGVVDIRVSGDDGKLVAVGRGTYSSATPA